MQRTGGHSAWLDASERRLLLFILFAKLLLIFSVVVLQAGQSNLAVGGVADWLGWWRRWDAPHYLRLAEYGYSADPDNAIFIVFFPLFPWLIRPLGAVIGDYHIAALLLSTVASLVLGLLLYRLTAMEYGRRVAQRAVLLLFVFPTSYVLHIAYTESLFLVLAVGAFYAARRAHWRVAAVLVFLAMMTRINGIFLVPALLWEAWRQHRDGESRIVAAWPLLLAPAGLLPYLSLNYLLFANPLQFLEYQSGHWHKQLAPPWQGVRGAWSWIQNGGEPWTRLLLGHVELLFAGLAVAASLAAAVWMRGSYALWTGLNTLLFLSTSFLQSTPRYCLVLFPMLMLGARLLRSPPAWTFVVCASAMLLSWFAWRFAMGQWAF
jgi:Gpi18-like mannosyltransferase